MDRDRKLTMTIHAEQNALLFAGREARACDAYVIGKPICNVCAMLLIQAGVRRVVAARPREGTASHWDRVGIEAVAMMREAGVGVRRGDRRAVPGGGAEARGGVELAGAGRCGYLAAQSRLSPSGGVTKARGGHAEGPQTALVGGLFCACGIQAIVRPVGLG